MELLMTGFGDLSSSKALLLGSSSGIKDCPDMHFIQAITNKRTLIGSKPTN
jgi:hypothetical protein